jgi:phage-related minor tail protein
MSSTVEELLVELGADDDDLRSAFASAEKTIKEFGDGLKEAGEKLTQYVSLPLTAFGGLAGKVANDFDSSQGRMQAQLGITAEEASKLGDVAEEVWKDNFGENVREVGDAVAIVKKNVKDLNAADLANVTESAFILRDVFEYEINESTRAAKALMDNFGVSGAKSFDYITVAAQKGADYSGELIDTINEYSTYFSAAGISIDGMFNILIQGAQNGAWNLDKVGDAVKEFNIRAKDGSESTADGFAAIGLDAKKMGDAIAKGGEDGEKAFMATVTALAAMKDSVKQNAAGVALFGTQWEDLEAKVVTALDPTKDMLGEVEGATQRAGQALNDNFGSRAIAIWREIQSSKEPIGNILLDMAEKAIPPISTAIADVSKWFENLGPSMQQAIVIFGIILAAIGPVLTIIGTLVGAIGSIGLVAAGIIAGIMLLAGAFILLWKNSETFRNGVTAVFNSIKAVALQVFGIVRDFIMQKVAEIQQFWAENGAQIMEAVGNVFNFIKAIVSFVMPFILMLIQSVWGNIKGVISGALNIIMGVIKIFAGLFTGDFGKMWEGIKQLFFGALEFLWNLFSLMMIGKLIGGIKAFITSGLGLFKSFGTAIKGTFSDFINNIINLFGYFRATGSSIWTALTSTVKNIVSGFVNTVKANFGSIWDNAVSIFSNVKNAIVHPIETAKNLVKGFIDEIKGFFKGLKLELPKIKMPHFKIKNWSKNPVDWIKAMPSLDIDWYAKGGVFNGASVIGVGEAGPEAVVPLQGHRMKPFANEIANQMNGNDSYGDSTIIIEKMQVRDEFDIQLIAKELDNLKKLAGRRVGIV